VSLVKRILNITLLLHLAQAPYTSWLRHCLRPPPQARPRARPRGGRPELLHAVAAKLLRALAHALRPNLAHAFFLSELTVAPSSPASSSTRRGMGSACRERGEGDERTGEGDEQMGLPLPSGCWKTSFLGL